MKYIPLFAILLFLSSCTVNRMPSMGGKNQAKLDMAEIETEIGFGLTCEKELRRQPVDESLFKSKTLYIVREHLQKKADQQSIDKIYPYKFKLVSRSKAMEAIKSNAEGVLILGQDFNRSSNLVTNSGDMGYGSVRQTPSSYVFVYDTAKGDCVGGNKKVSKYPNAGSVTLKQIDNLIVE